MMASHHGHMLFGGQALIRPNLPCELCQRLRCSETFQVQEEGGCGLCGCDTEECFWEDFEKNIGRTGEVRIPSAKVVGFRVGFIRNEVRSVNEKGRLGKERHRYGSNAGRCSWDGSNLDSVCMLQRVTSLAEHRSLNWPVPYLTPFNKAITRNLNLLV
jgi:hypothetical protein